MHAKPCFYCIILLTTLFISSCYWQPFLTDTPLSTPWSENVLTFADAINATLPSKLPHPTVIRAADRCWCDLTNGAFFEPFNVSYWEYLSVQRVKDSLEKRQKASDDLLRERIEPHEKSEEDFHSGDDENDVSSKIWAALKYLSPGFYNSFSNYMLPSEEVVDEHSEETLPTFFLPPSAPAIKSIPPALNLTAANLPLIRREYDFRPYGFDLVLDFGWSR